MESLQWGRVQTLSVLWAGTVDWQGVGFPLWKVCSGAECKLSLCSSRQGHWPGKEQASGSALESLQQGGVQTLSVLLQAGTVAGKDAGFPSWKVCSGEECKPSLCSSRRAQWPPGTTLLWEQKPSLAAMDHWAVGPALPSGCELVRQVGNSQANKLHPDP